MTTMELSRRAFVSGGTAAVCTAAAVATLGTQTAHAAEEIATGVPTTWDAEADIIAIGAGAAGLSAAIEAGEQGLSCIVLESQAVAGGNSIRCNGGMAIPGSPLQAELGIEDSADTMYDDLTAWYGCDYDEGYVRMLCDLNATYLYDWLTNMGLEFKASGLVQSNAHSVPREHHVNPSDLIAILQENAEKAGADIQFETRALHLIQNPATKRIIGVQVQQGDDIKNYKAKRAVMLCNGGYARNADMLNRYNFGEGAEKYIETAYDAPGIDGSGILMGQEVGAETRHMSYLSMLTVQNPDGNVHDACAMYHQGAVMVNTEGNRFVNEGQGYTNVWSELDRQPGAVCYQVWDDAIAQDCAENDSSYYSMAKIRATGLLLEADTLEELAQQMDIPADAFVATIQKYNDDIAAEGKDTVFNREHIAGTGVAPLALDTPPFYAFKTANVMCCTYGGLSRWEGDHLQAVTVFGDVIPGLYLAGAISDFCNQGCKPGTRIPINSSGTSLGGAMSFARKCVQEIAAVEAWDE